MPNYSNIIPALQWISLGMAPILLFGIYRLYDRQMIIRNQVQLINTFKYEIFEVQRSMNQYVASIEKYCELKAIDDSWFYSLTNQERHHMYQLRDYLGLDEIPDVNVATTIVKQISEQTLKILSSQLAILEEALGKLDIEKMRQLQQITKETEHSVAAFSKKQMDHIRSEIISSSRELQARGIWSVCFDYVIKLLEKIGVPLATKLIYHMLL